MFHREETVGFLTCQHVSGLKVKVNCIQQFLTVTIAGSEQQEVKAYKRLETSLGQQAVLSQDKEIVIVMTGLEQVALRVIDATPPQILS